MSFPSNLSDRRVVVYTNPRDFFQTLCCLGASVPTLHACSLGSGTSLAVFGQHFFPSRLIAAVLEDEGKKLKFLKIIEKCSVVESKDGEVGRDRPSPLSYKLSCQQTADKSAEPSCGD